MDVVVTEYGIARLKGFTLRERAQALIDIAHPADRPLLIEQAKAANIIYPDQIFLADSAQLYPAAVDEISRFERRHSCSLPADKTLRRRTDASAVLPVFR